jgi:hypothetical protein
MNRIRTHALIALGWIAVLFGSIAAADARPFDPMIGCWTGQAQLYDPSGAPTGAPVTSTGSVTWKTPHTVMHFKQVQAGRTLEYDLDVVGKIAKFRSPAIDVTGVEIDGRTYQFVLNFKTGPQVGTWYNVHYFTSKGRRRVMGGFQAGASNDGDVENLAIQRLQRIACYRLERIAPLVPPRPQT